jgi:hypothetical protein
MRKSLFASLLRKDLMAAFGHDMREFALLWLVFAVLDVLVAGKLTWSWALGNLGFTSLVWYLGAYIEMHMAKENG